MIVIALLALGALLAALQVTLPLAWSPLDLPLLLTLVAGLRRGRATGFMVGAFCGLCLDLWAGPSFGLRSVSLALAGSAADAFEGWVNPDQPRLQMAAAAIGSLVHDTLLMALAWHLGLPQGGLLATLGLFVLPRALAAAALAVPAFMLFTVIARQRVFVNPLARPPSTIRRWPGA